MDVLIARVLYFCATRQMADILVSEFRPISSLPCTCLKNIVSQGEYMFRFHTACCARFTMMAAVFTPLALAACNDTAPAPEQSSAQDQIEDPLLDRSVLTVEGLGVVRLGMSLQEMEQATGAAFAQRNPAWYESDTCWYTDRLENPSPNVAYMMNQDRLVRIDVKPAEEADGVPVHTASGFGVGSTEDAILSRYGEAAQKTPHPYLGTEGAVLRIPAPNADGVLLFETADGKVTRFRAGLAPEVDLKEGCS